MTEKQLDKLKVGDKLKAIHGDEAEVESIDRRYGSAVLHIENPTVDPDATAKVPVSFDGLLSHWDLVK